LPKVLVSIRSDFGVLPTIALCQLTRVAAEILNFEQWLPAARTFRSDPMAFRHLPSRDFDDRDA
jgi:hypothetical protein